MSFLSGLVPGLGIVKGMTLGLVRFFQPKATIMYPEVAADVSPRFRGRLQLLYDEYGTLKCETCFQCAQACPIECIDMGGVDTKGRYHVHWGPPETYGERREESALRRSGRPVPDAAYEHFEPIDLSAVDEILERYDHDPREMLRILEATNAAYGYLPVAALKRISGETGAWYAMVYGTASYYRHLRWTPPEQVIGVCRCTSCLMTGAGRVLEAIEETLGTQIGGLPTDGGVRIEQLPGHRPGAGAPLVTLDGEPVDGLRAETAAEWARGLASGDAGRGRPATAQA